MSKTIVITGAECSGKTTLAKDLSEKTSLLWLPEFAREFLTQLNQPYQYTDVVKLAKMQEEKQILFLQNNKNKGILDTDIITIKIWLADKFKTYPSWIDKTIIQHVKHRVYLLCSPNIPYQYDPLREDENRRFELFDIYKTELGKVNANFYVIEGSKKQRINLSLKYLNSLNSMP